MTDISQRCQSCGMPMDDGWYGKNADGTMHKEYCMVCWRNGEYKEPELTLEQMIQDSVKHMTTKMGFDKDKAEAMSRDIIPKLKRWQ